MVDGGGGCAYVHLAELSRALAHWLNNLNSAQLCTTTRRSSAAINRSLSSSSNLNSFTVLSLLCCLLVVVVHSPLQLPSSSHFNIALLVLMQKQQMPEPKLKYSFRVPIQICTLATYSFILCFDSSLYSKSKTRNSSSALLWFILATLDDTDNPKQVEKQKNTSVDSFSIACRSNTAFVVDFQIGKIILLFRFSFFFL